MDNCLRRQVPIHVLHLVEAFGAGTLTAISSLSQALQTGFRHTVVHGIRPETPSAFTHLFPVGTEFQTISISRAINPAKDFAAFLFFCRLLRRVQPDIVHCHSSKAGVVGRIAARFCSIPSVYTPHGYSFLRTNISRSARFFYKTVERACSHVGDAIAACGDEEYALALSLSGKRRVCRILNSVDLAAFASVVPFDWGEDKPVVGICGRFSPQRNPELFFTLAERLSAQSRWIWIGGDEVVPHPPGVLLTGWLAPDAALARIAGLDIYIQTSLWEGLSYSILEAMALGKPVIAYDIPANRAIVEHGITGFLGATPDQLADFVLRLVEEPKLRRSMGEAGRAKIAAQHDTGVVYKAYANLYRDLLS